MKKHSNSEPWRRWSGLFLAVPALIALLALSPVQAVLAGETAESIRNAQATELSNLDAEYDAKASQWRDSKTGRVNPNTPEYQDMMREYTAKQTAIQQKYAGQRRNLSSIDTVNANYKGEIDSSGSNIKDARSDMDYTAKSDEGARKLADEWKATYGEKNVKYDPHTGSYRNQVTDEVLWEPSNPQRAAARVYNPDAYTTHTPGQADGSNPYGQTLDHEKKFVDYGNKGDLRGQSKAASKMFEDTGIPGSETIKQADAMRNYQGEYRSGVKTFGDDPALQAKDAQNYQNKLGQEVETAKAAAKAKTDANFAEQRVKADAARAAGDTATADQIEKNIRDTQIKNMDVQDANMRAGEKGLKGGATEAPVAGETPGGGKGKWKGEGISMTDTPVAGEPTAGGEVKGGEVGPGKPGVGGKVLEGVGTAAGVVMVGDIGSQVKDAVTSDKPGENLGKVGVNVGKGLTGIGTVEHVIGSQTEKGEAEDAIVHANEMAWQQYRQENIMELKKAGVPDDRIKTIMDKFDAGDPRALDVEYTLLKGQGKDVTRPDPWKNMVGVDSITPDNTVGDRAYDTLVTPVVKAGKFFGAVPGDVKDAMVGYGEKIAAEGEAARNQEAAWQQIQDRLTAAHADLDTQRKAWEMFNSGDAKGAQGVVNDAYKDLVPIDVNGQTVYVNKQVLDNPFSKLKLNEPGLNPDGTPVIKVGDAPLTGLLDAKGNRVDKNTKDGFDNMGQNTTLQEGSTAGDAILKDAKAQVNVAGGIGQNTLDGKAGEIAGADKKGSTANIIGGAIIDGAGKGLGAGATVVGQAGAEKAGNDIFGKDDKHGTTTTTTPTTPTSSSGGTKSGGHTKTKGTKSTGKTSSSSHGGSSSGGGTHVITLTPVD